jgi:hypothetical protein
MNDRSRLRNKWYVGVLAPVAAALVWAVLAVRTPTSTFHFAPLVVAVVWPVFGRIGDGGPPAGRESLVVGASGGVIAVIAGLGLQAAGKLEGPTFWSESGAIVEVLIFAAVGTLYGLRGWITQRFSRTPASVSPSASSDSAPPP